MSRTMPSARLHVAGFLIGVPWGTVVVLGGDCPPAFFAEVSPSYVHSGDNFGWSVSAADGRVVVGVPAADDAGANSGTAHVFRWNGLQWESEAVLRAPDGAPGDWFGYAVAISGDVIVIGAPRVQDLGQYSGAAYVFRRADSGWTHGAKLLASDGGYGHAFGWSVAVVGGRVIVGAPGADTPSYNSGSAYVFAPMEEAWVEEGRIVPRDLTYFHYFGRSMAGSSDRVVIGAPLEETYWSVPGFAWVFRRQGEEWIEEAKLALPEGTERNGFAESVAIGDGHALVGAYLDLDGVFRTGAAYAFKLKDGSWEPAGRFAPNSLADGDWFGRAVAVSDRHAVVGAPLASTRPDNAGVAYVFSLTQNGWTERGRFTANPPSHSGIFGRTATIWDRQSLIGAPGGQGASGSTGTMSVFHLAPPLTGDANGNAVVAFDDVTAVLKNFGRSESVGNGPGDADHNGVVNLMDVTAVLLNYGSECP